jgi:amino acid transporter
VKSSADVRGAAALARTIGLPGALLLTLSAITPASSVFVILPGALKVAGTGTLVAMLAAMIVGVCMAFVYAELASAFPHTGGEYVFVARTLGPAPGFMFLGLTVLGALLSPAVLALGVGQYLAVLLPAIEPAPVAAVMIAGATLLGILNIRANAWLTGTFLAIELAALGVLTYLGLAHPARSLAEVMAHPVVMNDGHLQSATAPLIGVATALAIFAYNGYGGAVYFGEEMRNASTRIARTVLWALGLGVVTQIVPMAAVLAGAPDLDALLASERPFNEFIVARGGTALNLALSAGVALAMVNAVIVLMLSNARLLFSTGRDLAWSPGLNRALTRVHPRFHSPWGATLAAGAASIAPCWLSFDTLLIFTGTSLVAIYSGVCIAAIAGRRGGGTAHGDYRMPWFPIAPIFCLCFLAYVAYTNWIDPEIGRPSLIANGVVMLLAAAYYRRVVRRTGTWTLHGPETG